MTDTLITALLTKLKTDLMMRQAEFRNDHAISTAIIIALEEIAKRLTEDKGI